METCKICSNQFKNLKALSTHFFNKHNLSSKEYYDKFLIKKNEGECNICGEQTSYRNLGVGYLTNCSIECRDKNKDIKHDHLKGRKQSIEVINKRVANTNQFKKQKKLEETFLKRYGVTNISKLDSVKEKISIGNKGKKIIRNKEWQEKIIDSKRKNGTLNHSNKTKIKIKNKLDSHYQNNFFREKYIVKQNNSRYFCGWYKGLYFRSSLELSFLFQNKDKNFMTCEKNDYKVIYEIDGKEKVYYPDFTDGIFIYEIKPKSLISTKENVLKINAAMAKYGNYFKVITEIESPYLKKTKIFELINNLDIIVNKNSLKILKNKK